jgi:uncharacterized membrane protein
MPTATQTQEVDAPPSVVAANIRALLEERRRHDRARTAQERIADAVTAFSGSMAFLYMHILWFGLWIAINVGWLGIRKFDPFPFGLLTTAVSLEAIFLSTFVLISQNRMQLVQDRRSDLDLQINLLAEHEVTRLIHLVDEIAQRMHVGSDLAEEVEELKRDVTPEVLLRTLEEHEAIEAASGDGDGDASDREVPAGDGAAAPGSGRDDAMPRTRPE